MCGDFSAACGVAQQAHVYTCTWHRKPFYDIRYTRRRRRHVTAAACSESAEKSSDSATKDGEAAQAAAKDGGEEKDEAGEGNKGDKKEDKPKTKAKPKKKKKTIKVTKTKVVTDRKKAKLDVAYSYRVSVLVACFVFRVVVQCALQGWPWEGGGVNRARLSINRVFVLAVDIAD